MATSPTNNQIHHPVNIRFSLPFFGRRYFLTILGGSELRGPERRAAERQNHPIKTASNVVFVAGFAIIFYIIGFIAIAVQSSIVEF
tara:strand:+ start:1342 stop:1599 length:258 start_codon:yes stop_codon:yes gene_type:complete